MLMFNSFHRGLLTSVCTICLLATAASASAQTTAAPQQQPQQNVAPNLTQWSDEFDGSALDATKWEAFAPEGAAAGAAKAQVAGGQLRENGPSGGVRSARAFGGDRFLVEATLAKITAANGKGGDAVLAVLFDPTGRNRIEWGVTSDNKFEARQVSDGKSAPIEARQAAGAISNPKLGIARRGDDFYFTVNDQVQFQKTIANLPREFRVALYGMGGAESAWETAKVTAQEQPGAAAAAASPQSAPATGAAGGAAASGNDTAANADTWGDDFNGAALDATKWEQYTFEGGGGVKIEVKDGQLRQRGNGESRTGVRSVKSWSNDHFYVEASLADVGLRREMSNDQRGYAVLAVLLNGTATNRIEWVFTSDGQLQAWATTTPNGKLERLDNNKLATREKTPRLGIARRGDKILFLLNGQVGLERTVRGLASDFRVMLYGFGSSENDWDTAFVQTPKQ